MDAKELELLQDGYRFALSLTNEPAEAEDLVQDSWIKLYEKNGAIESRPLLFTVIRNKFIDQWRRKKSVPMVEFDAATEQPESCDDMDNQLLLKRVYDALEQISPHEREALYLQCIEEYTAQEISDLTGQPRGTVLSHISRGRKKLLGLLGFKEDPNQTKAENIIAFRREIG
ncbi:MAG: RNA polymerase sigma factor [Fibrobacterales bacterium]